MDGLDDRFILMRSGHGQNLGVSLPDAGFVRAHAAGDDDPAVLTHGLADRLEGFRACAVEKAACVDDDHVGAVIFGRQMIALRAQVRQDTL